MKGPINKKKLLKLTNPNLVLRQLFLLLVISTTLFGSANAQKEKDISIGKKIQLHSKILKSDREILIYLPTTYNQNNYTKYPVLYLLDGEKFFHSFTGAVVQMSSDASPQIPEMIVIGIPSQDRVKNSSPTKSTIGYRGIEEKGLEVSGGADDFLKFISQELVPYIDKNYQTNDYKTFVGYSFTGLTVLHLLFTQPDLFNSYISIDFSAWWDNEVTLKNMNTFFQTYKGNAKDIYLSTEERVDNVVYQETENKTWKFIQEFDKTKPSTISLGYKKYGLKEENHHSMPLISFIEGMKYLFRGFQTNYYEMYSEPQLMKARFDSISTRLGYKVFPREDLVDFLGTQFLNTHRDLDKAIFYLKYNTENYPLSINAWNNLSKAYNEKGDKINESTCKKKVLELKIKKNKLE